MRARTGELLAGQHTLAVTLANDMAVVMASRPEALDLLWQETGRAARSEGLALAVWRGGAPRYSLLAMNDLPELETLQPGQRSWQVRLVEGRHLFFATTALAGGPDRLRGDGAGGHGRFLHRMAAHRRGLSEPGQRGGGRRLRRGCTWCCGG